MECKFECESHNGKVEWLVQIGDASTLKAYSVITLTMFGKMRFLQRKIQSYGQGIGLEKF